MAATAADAAEIARNYQPFEEIGVFRRAGFKFEAWHDVSWWQKRLVNDP